MERVFASYSSPPPLLGWPTRSKREVLPAPDRGTMVTAAASFTPGRLLALGNNGGGNPSCREPSEYALSGRERARVRRFSVLKPGSLFNTRFRLLSIRPALTSSTTARATSEITRAPRKR